VLCCFRVEIGAGEKWLKKRGCGKKVKNNGEKVKNSGEKTIYHLVQYGA
jgi:hypothetical protein